MAEEGKFFYANGAEMALSPYDITFKFLRNGATANKVGEAPTAGLAGTDGAATILDAYSVAMSPSHAKAMISGVLRMIRAYEEQFGEIPLAADAKAAWNDAISKAKR